ncbi:hypothetical protein CRUP_026963 [Coryphaenoides rupestris]|nr:hypothetical protein CRUP_026963 [Coryphaenoides rupestris]
MSFHVRLEDAPNLSTAANDDDDDDDRDRPTTTTAAAAVAGTIELSTAVSVSLGLVEQNDINNISNCCKSGFGAETNNNNNNHHQHHHHQQHQQQHQHQQQQHHHAASEPGPGVTRANALLTRGANNRRPQTEPKEEEEEEKKKEGAGGGGGGGGEEDGEGGEVSCMDLLRQQHYCYYCASSSSSSSSSFTSSSSSSSSSGDAHGGLPSMAPPPPPPPGYEGMFPGVSVYLSDRRVCQVCGDDASGCHYGAVTCGSCKVFFKRAAAGKQNHLCASRNDCTIDKLRPCSQSLALGPSPSLRSCLSLLSLLQAIEPTGGFRDLHVDDQMSVIQSSWMGVMVFALGWRSYTLTNGSMLYFAPDLIFNEQRMQVSSMYEHCVRMQLLSQRFSMLRVTQEEFLCMKALLLFSISEFAARRRRRRHRHRRHTVTRHCFDKLRSLPTSRSWNRLASHHGETTRTQRLFQLTQLLDYLHPEAHQFTYDLFVQAQSLQNRVSFPEMISEIVSVHVPKILTGMVKPNPVP